MHYAACHHNMSALSMNLTEPWTSEDPGSLLLLGLLARINLLLHGTVDLQQDPTSSCRIVDQNVFISSLVRCVLCADPGSLAERRATEAVYLAVRYHVYQKVTPAIMVVGIVGNVLSLVLGVRCRPQMSSLDCATGYT